MIYPPSIFCVQYMRVIMCHDDNGRKNIPKADYDLMAIMYSTNGIHHRLCNIDGNNIPGNPASNSIMKTEPSISPTTPPFLGKLGSQRFIHPLTWAGQLAWGVHWPWYKAVAVAIRIWWYNPLRHTTTEKYTGENTFARCQSSVGYLAKYQCCIPSDRGPDSGQKPPGHGMSHEAI